jgi:hypothetical protein
VRPTENILKIFVNKWVGYKLMIAELIAREDVNTFIRRESLKSYMNRTQLIIAELKYESFIVQMAEGLGN